MFQAIRVVSNEDYYGKNPSLEFLETLQLWDLTNFGDEV